MIAARNKYARTPPTSSVLGTAIRLWRHAARGKWSLNPVKLYKNFTAPGFWDNAKPSKQVGGKPAWMNFDDTWVDEVKRGVKACTVFLWYPIYCGCYSIHSLNNLFDLIMIVRRIKG